MIDRRNPYVELGLSFGASKDEAAYAFARCSRGLRRKPDGPERLQELTWALNRIEEQLRDPQLALDVFRVPADPGALVAEGVGIFGPPPEAFDLASVDAESAESSLFEAAAQEAGVLALSEIAASAPTPAR